MIKFSYQSRKKSMMTEKNYIADMRALVGHTGMIFVTAFGVLWNDGRSEILLERRADSPDTGWGFPGGFLEYGESPMQAVVREFKEETGLDVEVVRILGLSTNINDKNAWGDAQENIAIGFEVQLVGGSIHADGEDRKSTRLNSSHHSISYAVFCLKKESNLGQQDQPYTSFIQTDVPINHGNSA